MSRNLENRVEVLESTNGSLTVLWAERGRTGEELIAEHEAKGGGKYIPWPLSKSKLDE